MLPRHKTVGFTTELDALIKSPVWSEVRGSVGGTTYARNKTGQYARNRSKPVNPNTAKQSFVRSQFQTNAYGFSLLTIEQVLAWNQFAQGYPAVNRVGDTYTPSGRQVYMLCNQNLASIGIAAIDAPPYDVPVVPDCNITGAGVTITNIAGAITVMQIDGVTSGADTNIQVIQATPNMQPSRQSYRNRMRQMIHDEISAGTLAFASEWNAYFGNPAVTEGQIINVRVSVVDPASGVASAWVYLQAVVPAVAP